MTVVYGIVIYLDTAEGLSDMCYLLHSNILFHIGWNQRLAATIPLYLH